MRKRDPIDRNRGRPHELFVMPYYSEAREVRFYLPNVINLRVRIVRAVCISVNEVFHFQITKEAFPSHIINMLAVGPARPNSQEIESSETKTPQ